MRALNILNVGLTIRHTYSPVSRNPKLYVSEKPSEKRTGELRFRQATIRVAPPLAPPLPSVITTDGDGQDRIIQIKMQRAVES
jgi:hypothetical protein